MNALTVMLTFVPGSREEMVKANVAMSVVLTVVTAFIVYETSYFVMIPFGLTGVNQETLIDLNLMARVSEATSPGAV